MQQATKEKVIEGSVIREAEDPAAQPLAKSAARAPAVRKVASDPMAILAEMVRQGNVDVDALDKLTAVAERWRANDAKAAFAADFAEFKKERIEILKDAGVRYENRDASITEYRHATLVNVCDKIAAALGRHNMAHAWRVNNAEGKVNVTTVLRHVSGHEEELILSSAADKSGGKNDIQAIGSAISYLQRYGLLAITGHATKGMDDDGRSSEGNGIALSVYTDLVSAIEGASTEQEVARAWQSCVKACEEFSDWEAYRKLKQIAGARKAALKK